jgi:hypothetical protein
LVLFPKKRQRMSDKKTASVKLNKKIKDDIFNVDNIAHYNLSLQISPILFRLCVTDSEKNRCMLLEDYQFSSVYLADHLIEKLEEIFDDHHVLKAGFWKSIKLAFKTPNFSLVPESLFEQELAKEYLTLNCSLKPDDSEEVLFYKQSSIDIVNVFSAEKKILQWFSAMYPGKTIRTIHHTSSLIDGVLFNRSNNKEDRSMFIFVDKNQLTIIVTKNRKLEFCNSFNFFSPEDFVYYVMFVAGQLQFNADADPAILWGDILPDSELYLKLYKYVRNVSFGDKPSSLYFGYTFDEVFDHNFFDLYSMHFCE